MRNIIDLSMFKTDSSFLYAFFYSIYDIAINEEYTIQRKNCDWDAIRNSLDDIMIFLEFIYNNENYKDLCIKKHAIIISSDFNNILKDFFENIKPDKGVLYLIILLPKDQIQSDHFITLLKDFPFNFDKYIEIHVEEKIINPNNIYIC